MTCCSWLAGLCLLLQVPPPTQGAEAAQRLEAARRSIILREAAELGALADESSQLHRTFAQHHRSCRLATRNRSRPVRSVRLVNRLSARTVSLPPRPGFFYPSCVKQVRNCIVTLTLIGSVFESLTSLCGSTRRYHGK